MFARIAALVVATTVAAWSVAPVGPSVECEDHDDAAVVSSPPASGRFGTYAQLKDDCCKVRPAARLPLATTPERFAFHADTLALRSWTITFVSLARAPRARRGPLDGQPPPLERVLPLLD